jgi:ATP-dependent RNA helicase RhlE
MNFNELSLSEPLLKALQEYGYTQPTPVQAKAIPVILSGADVFGSAQTGTGKTAAFSLPLLQLLSKRKNTGHIAALILAPTRELASQISENITAYSKYLPIRQAIIFGGVSQRRQEEALRKRPQIVVATPGRLMDLMQQGLVKLDQVEFLVLDEADRMLDMGFIRDIRKIVALMTNRKQTLFFSATASKEIMKLTETILKNPVRIAVSPVSETSHDVEQSLYYVSKEDKRSLLKQVINESTLDQVLVFTRTKHGADRVVKDLNRDGIASEAIHGNKSQNARERALKGFKDRKIRVLVATDIASRGIDVEKLGMVINFEIPEQAETYVHRIGRTGRAGNTGRALSFCDASERNLVKDIHKLIKKNIPVVNAHPFNKNKQ